MSNDLVELNYSVDGYKKLVAKFMNTKHYAVLGEEGIVAILTAASALKMDPFYALNQGLYYTNGRVGMYALEMNARIREAGHSIKKDPKSDHTMCILHGRRGDNGDEWTVKFSIDDAKRAWIYKDKSPWTKYPEDMLFYRALSRLAKQLFPDVIRGTDVVETLSDYAINNSIAEEKIEEIDLNFLYTELESVPEYRDQLFSFYGSKNLSNLSKEDFERILNKIKNMRSDVVVEPEEIND